MDAASAINSRFTSTMDIGSLVDVGDRQGLSIEQCDIIHQAGPDFGGDVEAMLASNGAITTQVSDLNPGGAFVRADDVNLIASGSLNIDVTNNIASNQGDFFRGNDGALTNASTPTYVTVRLKCRIVTLTTKDWIALAITSVAND